MANFDTYFLMKENDAIEYAKAKVPQKNWDEATMECKEIGDGNLNYVFKVKDAKGNSVIVKQAGIELRISKDMKIDTDRNRVESEILLLYGKLAPGLVPEIYDYDTVMCACCMEDLSDHEVMRGAMIEHKIFPKFADQISTYMARVLMGTTDVVMDHQEKKKPQKMRSPLKLKKSCSPLMIRKMRFPHPRKKPCCFPMMYFRCRSLREPLPSLLPAGS